MAAALVFGQELAAVVVALMYAGGQYLESFSEHHPHREMTALLARVPRAAVRHRNGALEEVALDTVRLGDRLPIRRGDVAPVGWNGCLRPRRARSVGFDGRVDFRTDEGVRLSY